MSRFRAGILNTVPAARRVRLVLALLAVGAAIVAPAAPAAAAGNTPRERVEHHLRAVGHLSRHFEHVLAQACPRFARRTEWSTYLDGEIDRLVLLLAHREQAWEEAKQTGDDELRRSAKTSPEQRAQARALVDKFEACAQGNGAALPTVTLWRRIERDVERRRAEIALP